MTKQEKVIRDIELAFYLDHEVEKCISENLNKIVFNTDAVESVAYFPDRVSVLWKDQTETTMECVDMEKGLAMCIIKKMCGNDEAFRELFERWCPGEKNEPKIIHFQP